MENKLLKAIKEYSLIEDGDKIIVALSGGADSTALLCSLMSIRESLSLTIYACHINHLLRGDESFRDENFVRELCEKLGVELFVLQCDINKLASERNLGSEECGRQVRYDFLNKNATRLGAKIATAHTSTDSMETILMNISRGSGIKGARGIPPKRDNIIRPLILASRADTEEYCKSHNIPYVNDSTNSERLYTRNKVRLDVVPVLREINPSIEEAFLRFSKSMKELDEFIEKSAQTALSESKIENGYSCEKLKKLDKPILARTIEILCNKENIEPESVHIELIEKAIKNSGAVSIKNGIMAISSQGIFRIYHKNSLNDSERKSEIPVFINSSAMICNKNIRTELVNMEEFLARAKFTKNLFTISLDYATISDGAVFRNRKAGDFIAPKGRGLTKPLSKLMSEMKIPAEKRDSAILLADENNILWAEEIGVSEQCCVKNTTQKVLMIYIDE